jgi:hypothetical protein
MSDIEIDKIPPFTLVTDYNYDIIDDIYCCKHPVILSYTDEISCRGYLYCFPTESDMLLFKLKYYEMISNYPIFSTSF